MTCNPRVALITGANRGLGLALTGAFGRAGFHVVATSRSDSGRDAAEEVLAATEGPADRGKRIWCHLDISQEEDVRKVAETCVAANKGLLVPDVLVHNAGVCLPGAVSEHAAPDICDELLWAGSNDGVAPTTHATRFRSGVRIQRGRRAADAKFRSAGAPASSDYALSEGPWGPIPVPRGCNASEGTLQTTCAWMLPHIPLCGHRQRCRVQTRSRGCPCS